MIHDWQAQCQVYIERIEMLERIAGADGQEIAQLRADLATVTAERDADRAQHVAIRDHRHATALQVLAAERAAHAETRKALEETSGALRSTTLQYEEYEQENEALRGELAKSEARVKELLRQKAGGGWTCD
jgi:chromosome segregation ATPase